jgi:hypothetical protein
MEVNGETLPLNHQICDFNGSSFEIYLSNENNVNPPANEVIVWLHAYDGGTDNTPVLGEYSALPLGASYDSGLKFYGGVIFNGSYDYMIDTNANSRIVINEVTPTYVKGSIYLRVSAYFNSSDTREVCVNFQQAERY